MGYYFRVFCATEAVPPLADVLQWVKEKGEIPMTVDPVDATWGSSPLRLHYAEDAPPFDVELDRRDGDDSPAALVCAEFIRLVEALRKSRKRDSVLDHLKKTRFVVTCEVPPEGFKDDRCFHAIDVFLAYFESHCEGIVQADGQGFYQVGKLLVELEEVI